MNNFLYAMMRTNVISLLVTVEFEAWRKYNYVLRNFTFSRHEGNFRIDFLVGQQRQGLHIGYRRNYHQVSSKTFRIESESPRQLLTGYYEQV
jgi:hypothetical protein